MSSSQSFQLCDFFGEPNPTAVRVFNGERDICFHKLVPKWQSCVAKCCLFPTSNDQKKTDLDSHIETCHHPSGEEDPHPQICELLTKIRMANQSE